MGRNVFDNNAAATNNDITAYGYAGEYLDTSTYPYIITNGDWICVFKSFIAALKIYGVASCVKSAVWSYKDVITKSNLSTVKNHGIVIGKKVLANFYVISVIAPKGSNNGKISVCFSEEFFHDFDLTILFGWS